MRPRSICDRVAEEYYEPDGCYCENRCFWQPDGRRDRQTVVCHSSRSACEYSMVRVVWRLWNKRPASSLFTFSPLLFFFFFLFRQRPFLSIPRFTIYGIFVGWDNNFRFLVLANLIIEINFVSSEFSFRERERDRSFFIFLFLERILPLKELPSNILYFSIISVSLPGKICAKYVRYYFFFFFFHHPSTHVERRIRRRMDEEDEIGATPYCSVDKYSDRAREFSSLSGREKPGRKIHRSPWNDVYIPLKRESSLYERSHLPDKGTNNRSLPSPPLPSIFLVAPWTGNGDSTTSRLRNRSKSR